MSSTVSNGLGFTSYETGLSMYRRLNEGVSPGPAERGVIAGGAAVTVMAAIQPLEVCCRRMQVCSHPMTHHSLPSLTLLRSMCQLTLALQSAHWRQLVHVCMLRPPQVR
jgi:hypothetical protein